MSEKRNFKLVSKELGEIRPDLVDQSIPDEIKALVAAEKLLSPGKPQKKIEGGGRKFARCI